MFQWIFNHFYKGWHASTELPREIAKRMKNGCLLTHLFL